MSAWNAANIFPSRVQAHLWRISAVYIAGAGVLWIGINLLACVSEVVWWFGYDVLAGHASQRAKTVLDVLCGVGGGCYVFARCFIVVEHL